MGNIRVTPEELEGQAGKVRTEQGNIEASISMLQNQILDLGGRWEGAGSAAFQQLFEEWRTGAAQVKEAMTGISSLLTQGAQAYRQADESVKAATGH